MVDHRVENFGTELARATSLESREILGAIGLVVDRYGDSPSSKTPCL